MSNISVPILRKPAHRMVPTVFCILVCALTTTTSAQTMPVCEGLKAILSASNSQYVNLRSAFDSVWDAYRGTIALGTLTDCFTHSSENLARYTCKQRLPDDVELVKQSFEALTTDVKACFGGDVKPMKTSIPERRAMFRNVVGGESIYISYQRLVPKYKEMVPRYLLSLEITITDMNGQQ